MNNQPQTRYIKSFSKGQITIPKEIREKLGVGDEFWMKVSIDKDEIKLTPVKEEKKINREEWMKNLLKMPTFDISMEEIRGVPSRTVAGSPWVKELYAHFAPLRKEAKAANYSEEEINVTIDKAVKAVRKNHD